MIDHPKTGPHFKHRKTLQMGRNSQKMPLEFIVAQKAGVMERLTAHSFRRGGTQHANEAGLCVQWIFDRGAWNMAAFAYVFNTPSEDHKIARVLSNRKLDAEVSLLSLDGFDSDTHQELLSVALALFVASFGLDTAQ
ncbi:hypothetical protein PHMEG_00022402 [Phytophthora megakarya]|uniref:Uncharacterized protein n=1 Tax=Phytophthora megakarya TaxID=4795 RepID=A0A225VJJ9_9STRA|nr:hypothetical protein PHMEG_00022402 [Phytophthora megakarya]